MRLLGLNRWFGTAIILLPFAYIGFTSYGLRSHWGADQWGDFATWIAGIATSAAVLVALWQTHLARRDAAQARIDAAEAVAQARIDAAAEVARVNERLTKELEAADNRLARELDASRRMEQLRTIPPIWDAVTTASTTFFTSFKEAMRTGPTANTDEAVAEWEALHYPFMTAVQDLELSFSPAVMLISELNTQRLVVDLYKKTRLIHGLALEAARVRLIERRTPDLSELENLLKHIREQRKPMTAVVREHLTQVPPLDDSSSS